MISIAGVPYDGQIDRYDIDMNKENRLGKGAIGKVYRGVHTKTGENVRGVHTNTGENVAAKKIKEQYNYDIEYGRNRFMQTLPLHENIVKVYDLIEDNGLWIITELCKGNLAAFCEDREQESATKLELFYQTALAVQHLHKYGVIHRMIKPENVLITGDLRTPQVKLCDFLFGSGLMEGEGTPLMAGTRAFCAPEQTVLSGQYGFETRVDTFSLGATALALLDSKEGSVLEPRKFCGRSLNSFLGDMHKTCDMDANKDFTLPIINHTDGKLDRDMKEIIKKMLQINPCDRPSMDEVVKSLSELR